MLESCLGTFIWYVFEGAQCLISKFLFSNITQMGHFLEQVSIQKPGAQPHGHNFFKAAHFSDLKNVFSTTFSMH
jgi:hypothetical protein